MLADHDSYSQIHDMKTKKMMMMMAWFSSVTTPPYVAPSETAPHCHVLHPHDRPLLRRLQHYAQQAGIAAVQPQNLLALTWNGDETMRTSRNCIRHQYQLEPSLHRHHLPHMHSRLHPSTMTVTLSCDCSEASNGDGDEMEEQRNESQRTNDACSAQWLGSNLTTRMCRYVENARHVWS